MREELGLLMRSVESKGRASSEALRDHEADFAPGLDSICRAAARLFDVPIAFVNLMDERRGWLKGRWGVEPLAAARVSTFCNDTILLSKGEVLIVPDLCAHRQYADCELVTSEPCVRFYAGVPIALQCGDIVGTLCVLDRVPRADFGSAEIALLQDFAHSVEAHLLLHEAHLAQAVDAEERRRTKALLAFRESTLRKDEQAIRESERRFRLLAENTTDIVIWSDLDTTRRYVSPAAKSVLGYDPEELIGTTPIGFVHPDDADGYRSLLDDLCRGAVENAVTTQRYRRKDGTYVWIEVSFSLTRDEHGGPITGYVASLRDVSDRKRIEEDLRVSEERQAMALDSGSDGIWDLDIPTGDVRLSGPWLTILGYMATEIAPNISAWEAITHPDDLPLARAKLLEHFKGRTAKFECEYRLRKKTDGYVWTLARGKVVARDGRGRATRMVGTHIDVTQRRETEALIAHMALHDPLTGLANRTLFQDRLDQEIGYAERHGGSFAVLACDLDRFKNVNDTLGHTAGDRLLCRVADILSAIVRDGDTVARLGGDEFAIILRQINGAREASAIADRIVSAVGDPIEIDDRSVGVGISIGIVVGPGQPPEVTAEHLFKNADIALYRAKAEGRDGYCFFEPGMDAIVAERTLLDHNLRSAVKRGEFELHYQPFVDLATDRVDGFEALLRWRHPTGELINPGDFIPVAEETGLIVTIGDWALHEACQQAASWPKHLRIAVNVSAVQFHKPHQLTHTVVAALAASGLTPDRLELEITESVLMKDAEAVIACLLHLRELGVRIALDDFGTGYSSLAYLRRFPFSKIKIDRTFVREIDDPGTAAIVQAVVGLGKRVAADITAEGVETQDQRAQVVAAGCTQMQGFLFSKPVTAGEATAIVSQESSKPRKSRTIGMDGGTGETW